MLQKMRHFKSLLQRKMGYRQKCQVAQYFNQNFGKIMDSQSIFL